MKNLLVQNNKFMKKNKNNKVSNLLSIYESICNGSISIIFDDYSQSKTHTPGIQHLKGENEEYYLKELSENELDTYIKNHNENKKYSSSDKNLSFLYKGDIKISDIVFRKGGLGGTYKDGYCQLLEYGTIENPKSEYYNGCVVDIYGNIVLKQSQEKGLGNIYLKGGILAMVGDYLYNLKTGKPFLKPMSSKLETYEFMFVETYTLDEKYYNPEIAKIQKRGVYKINKFTSEMQFFPDKKS